ncbi:MAG: NADH-quinone oxidoreductase subunit C [Thermoprotei archaeon]|nr:MAG: NADH-quinone oxidoreductase subunit C [Thermoprotei archaeon]RLE56832.1 MAG: NADH-quinone oxidoreductase subunit C [Thermoprotei archaeon]
MVHLVEVESEVAEYLRTKLGDKLFGVATPKKLRVVVRVSSDAVKSCIRAIQEKFGDVHLTTITGCDLGEELELTYHLHLYANNVHIMVKTKVPKSEPKIDTITDVIPGAVLYEREVYEMLGIQFIGHPKLERLFLPDDWPEGIYPLRKDWRPEGLK